MITNPLSIIAVILGTILLVPLICRILRIPSIVGFIVVGMLIGPKAFHLIDGDDAIQALGYIGMLYIMLQAGIEIDINDFRQQRNYSILFGIYSFIFPFVLGVGTSLLLGFNSTTSILLGAMYGSHTLMTYPIASRYGVQKNPAVNIAIGGTIFTILLSLLVLVIVKSNFIYNYASTTWWMIARSTITLVLITIVFPLLAQSFFKRSTDPNVGFLIVMTLMVVSALLADWCGLEGILGAFICGVALNKLVPNLSPVMMRINFVGNNIFVPLFLIGVGMLIDMSAFWSGWGTILIAVVMIVTKLAGKWLATRVAQKHFGMQVPQRQIMFGLTHATAAGTLAIVTIGYQIGIFNAEILNASVLMILVLCTTASFVTEYAAKRLALQENARLEADKAGNEWLMMTVGEKRHFELKELGELSELPDPELSAENSWSEAMTHINRQRKATIVYHPTQPLNTISRLLVAVPRYAEKEHDFISCFGLVRRLSSQIGARVIFYTNENTQRELQAFCRRKDKFLRASFREMENWEDVLMLAKQMKPDDMIVLFNARPATPSFNPLFEQLPSTVTTFFSNHSYMIVYPEQETGATVPDLLYSDNIQASRTWSSLIRLNRKIVFLLQTRPTKRTTSRKTSI